MCVCVCVYVCVCVRVCVCVVGVGGGRGLKPYDFLRRGCLQKQECWIVTYFSKHNSVWLLYVVIMDHSFADSVMISCSSGSRLSSSSPKQHLRFLFSWTHEAQKNELSVQ